MAQKQLLLNKPQITLSPEYCLTIEDSSTRLTLRDLLSPYWQQQFVQRDNQAQYNAQRSSAYWKKFTLRSSSPSTTWLLEFPDPHIGSLEVYVVLHNQQKKYQATGYTLPFTTRSIPHKNFLYEIETEQGVETVVYVRFYSKRYCYMTPVIRSIRNYSAYFLPEYHLLGIYYGIIVILVVYNFFLGFFVKDKVYFFYCIYIICCALFTYAEDGLGFQWLWPDNPQLNALVERFVPALLLISYFLYSNSFIELQKYSPLIQKLIMLSGAVYLCIFFIWPDSPQVQRLFYTLPFLFTYLAAIVVYRKGFRPARFFLVGSSIVLISFIVYFCRINGWIASTITTVYLFNFGFILDATILSISLADKVKNSKEANEKAQKEIIQHLRINEELQHKVTRELELKVQERTRELLGKTQELTESNRQLESLKKDLYDMNSKMDLSIWQLKKAVQQETEARITDHLVSFEDFAGIYPEKKCYNVLKDLKWPNGFVCKCGNTKCGPGKNDATYKCTQCQHQESITANTLFHGVRFPLQKAFYLAYYLTRHAKTTSYQELGERLELNKNTIWKFHKKLQEMQLDAKNNKAIVPSWGELLLKK